VEEWEHVFTGTRSRPQQRRIIGHIDFEEAVEEEEEEQEEEDQTQEMGTRVRGSGRMRIAAVFLHRLPAMWRSHRLDLHRPKRHAESLVQTQDAF
jgi:hypothetical protein